MTLRSTLTLIASVSLSVAALASSGCSSDDAPPEAGYSCSAKGPCPRDPVPSTSEAKACEALGRDPTCGSAFVAYSKCAFSAKMCSDAGVSDSLADSVNDACNSDYATYTTCLQNKRNEPGAAGAGDAPESGDSGAGGAIGSN